MPPRRITWHVSLPVVWKIADTPCLVTDGKQVRRSRRQHRVNRGLRRAVGAVLEADRHRQPRRQLAVHLALGRARADRDPRREVGDVLRDLRVEELRRRRQPDVVHVEQQLARQAQPLVDVEALVEVGIVDEPLPADRACAASRSSSASTTIRCALVAIAPAARSARRTRRRPPGRGSSRARRRRPGAGRAARATSAMACAGAGHDASDARSVIGSSSSRMAGGSSGRTWVMRRSCVGWLMCAGMRLPYRPRSTVGRSALVPGMLADAP